MSYKYFKPNMRILVQGATGKEGTRGVEFMKNYHMNVVAGVTPKKGGQEVHGVPIFNTVKEACNKVGDIDATVLYVPQKATKAAIVEAVEAGILFVKVLTEGIPYQDLAYIAKFCKNKGVTLLGPGSLGMLVVGEGRIGMIGGENPDEVYCKGSVSVISRSGGMTNEIAHFLCTNNIGVRIVVHLGTEMISGTSLVDHIKALYRDDETKSIVIFEELTHASLGELVAFVKQERLKKPIFLYLAGLSQSIMPHGASFGHVDALLGREKWKKNLEELRSSEVTLVDSYEQFVNYLS